MRNRCLPLYSIGLTTKLCCKQRHLLPQPRFIWVHAFQLSHFFNPFNLLKSTLEQTWSHFSGKWGYNIDYNIGSITQKRYPKMHILFSFSPEENFRYAKNIQFFSTKLVCLIQKPIIFCTPCLPQSCSSCHLRIHLSLFLIAVTNPTA